MISDKIFSILSVKKQYSNTRLANDTASKGKNLFERLTIFFESNGISDTNPSDVFESLFCSILLSIREVNSLVMNKYEKLCEKISIVPSFTNHAALISLRSQNGFDQTAIMLAKQGIYFFTLMDDEYIRDDLADFLVSFSVLIGNYSTKILEIIQEIIDEIPCIYYTEHRIEKNASVATKHNTASAMGGALDTIENTTQDIIIIETGGTVENSEYEDRITVGAILKNPNKYKVAKNIQVCIKLYNDESFIVDEQVYYINCILPDATFGFGCDFGVSQQNIKRFEVRVECDSFREIMMSELSSVNYKFDYVTTQQTYNYTQIKYNLTINKGILNIRNYSNAHIIYRDKKGKIIGGTNSYLSNISFASPNLVVFYSYTNIEKENREVYFEFNL